MKKKCIVTTSWDDGYPYDARLSPILKKYGIKGTFYIPTVCIGNILSGEEVFEISTYHEIGGHTNSHFNMTVLSPEICTNELINSKTILETLTGKEVNSFCYPYGLYNKVTKELVRKTGYKSARTIASFNTKISDPFEMHPTLHISNRGIKYCIKGSLKMRIPGFSNFYNWSSLAKKSFDKIYENGGIWHLWGHSWELETQNLWDTLEDILKYVSQRNGVSYLTNGELVESMSVMGRNS